MPVTLAPAPFTSLTYTTTASASPRMSLARVDFTSSSFDAGFGAGSPALVKACRAYFPAGTEVSASTSVIPGFSRSASVAMCFGFPGATAISSRLRANVFGVWTRPASTSSCMLEVSAEAKTSAGAPCWIWATRAWEPAKFNVSERAELPAARFAFSISNGFVNDAAANTLRAPASLEPVAVVGPELAGESDALPLLPQAASRSTRAPATAAAARRERRDIDTPCSQDRTSGKLAASEERSLKA